MTGRWQAVRERAWVWVLIVCFSTAILVALAPFFVLGADVAEEQYGTDAVYGFANAAWGVGTVCGAVVGARRRPRRPLLAATAWAVPWPGCIAVFALGLPRPVLYALMALAGLGIGLFAVWWETALAQRIPPHLLSRVSAWDWMGSLALLPLGYLLAGPVAERVGGVEVLVVGGVLGVVVMALGLLSREVRTLPRLEDVPVRAVVEAPTPLGPV